MYALFLDRMGKLYKPEKIKGQPVRPFEQTSRHLNGSEQMEGLAL